MCVRKRYFRHYVGSCKILFRHYMYTEYIRHFWTPFSGLQCIRGGALRDPVGLRGGAKRVAGLGGLVWRAWRGAAVFPVARNVVYWSPRHLRLKGAKLKAIASDGLCDLGLRFHLPPEHVFSSRKHLKRSAGYSILVFRS